MMRNDLIKHVFIRPTVLVVLAILDLSADLFVDHKRRQLSLDSADRSPGRLVRQL